MKAKKQNFEESLARLEAVVRELEDGNITLEKSLALFAEGIALSKFCHLALEEAETRISVLTEDNGGKLSLKDLPSRD
jgi:exodeoxyribonuclease VII small subunit